MADKSSPDTGYPATATAYPYVPLPQHPPLQPPQNQGTYVHATGNRYYSDPDTSQQRLTFVQRLLVASVIMVFIFGMWLSFCPVIPEFRVDTLTLSNFNISSNSIISGNWDARFTVRNPSSKITLHYDQMKVYLFYKSDLISETTVPPFVQGTKNETAIRSTSAPLTAYVDGINGEFIVVMKARVRFDGAWWARRRIILRVYCPYLSIGVSATSNGGSLVGGSMQCWVDLGFRQ